MHRSVTKDLQFCSGKKEADSLPEEKISECLAWCKTKLRIIPMNDFCGRDALISIFQENLERLFGEIKTFVQELYKDAAIRQQISSDAMVAVMGRSIEKLEEIISKQKESLFNGNQGDYNPEEHFSDFLYGFQELLQKHKNGNNLGAIASGRCQM